MDLSSALTRLANYPLPHHVMVSLLSDFQRPNDKIAQLTRNGSLQVIKKGLYIVGPQLNENRSPEPFLLANHILGPSYVSAEAALSYHGLIPERVFEITSMTTKTARKFATPMGRYTYRQLPLPYYAFGIQSQKLAEDQYAMVASPEKALFDKIIVTPGLVLRSKKMASAFMLDNMRMDETILKQLNVQEMESWIEGSLKEESLSMILKAIKEL